RWAEPWQALESSAYRWTVPVEGGPDERRVTGVRIPARGASGAGGSTLLALRGGGARLDSAARAPRPITVVPVTDLAIHGRLGTDQAAVWVTGVDDGLPRPGAEVVLHDANGEVRATATTDAAGLALLDDLPAAEAGCGAWGCGFEGYIAATLD